MKILNKATIIGFAIGLITAAGLVYAAQNITTLTQTAQTGDKLTSTWVNAVNTKLNNVSATGNNGISCYYHNSYGAVCCKDLGTTFICKAGSIPGTTTW